MHRMHRIFSGKGQLVILGIRKPAPNPRPSRLLVQEPHVQSILYILCIHVHKSIDSPVALTASAFAYGSASATPTQGGSDT